MAEIKTKRNPWAKSPEHRRAIGAGQRARWQRKHERDARVLEHAREIVELLGDGRSGVRGGES